MDVVLGLLGIGFATTLILGLLGVGTSRFRGGGRSDK